MTSRTVSRARVCPWGGAVPFERGASCLPNQGTDCLVVTTSRRQPAGTGRRSPGAFSAIRAVVASIPGDAPGAICHA